MAAFLGGAPFKDPIRVPPHLPHAEVSHLGVETHMDIGQLSNTGQVFISCVSLVLLKSMQLKRPAMVS